MQLILKWNQFCFYCINIVDLVDGEAGRVAVSEGGTQNLDASKGHHTA